MRQVVAFCAILVFAAGVLANTSYYHEGIDLTLVSPANDNPSNSTTVTTIAHVREAGPGIALVIVRGQSNLAAATTNVVVFSQTPMHTRFRPFPVNITVAIHVVDNSTHAVGRALIETERGIVTISRIGGAPFSDTGTFGWDTFVFMYPTG